MAQQFYTFQIINEGKHEVRIVKADTEEQARAQLPAGCTIKTTEARNEPK